LRFILDLIYLPLDPHSLLCNKELHFEIGLLLCVFFPWFYRRLLWGQNYNDWMRLFPHHTIMNSEYYSTYIRIVDSIIIVNKLVSNISMLIVNRWAKSESNMWRKQGFQNTLVVDTWITPNSILTYIAIKLHQISDVKMKKKINKKSFSFFIHKA